MPFPTNTLSKWKENKYEPLVGYKQTVNNGAGMYWELRLSILPTHDNLEKAKKVLAELFKKNYDDHKRPNVKIMYIHDDDYESEYNKWDGTRSCLNIDKEGMHYSSDRDQRGKEFCIFIHHDENISKGKDGFVFTQTYMKEMMLNIWKALEDAGVALNYQSPGASEKEVPADIGIATPFSYSSFKPYANETGILLATEYNPMKHPDPLQQFEISKKDLDEKNIKNYDFLTIHQNRLKYMEAHAAETKTLLEKFANDILADKQLPFENLWALLDKDDEHINVNQVISFIQTHWAKLQKALPAALDGGEKVSLLSEIPADTPQNKQKWVIDLKNKINLSMDQLEKLMQPYLRGVLERTLSKKITKLDLEKMLAINPQNSNALLNIDFAKLRLQSPGALQSLYFSMTLHQREINAIEQEKQLIERYKNLPSTLKMTIRDLNVTVKIPDSYSTLTNKYQTVFAQAQSLLEDYTKHDSLAKRFFTFHLLRHHIDAVSAITKKINEGKISTMLELIPELQKIENIKPNGSLSKRLKTIYETCYNEMRALAEKKAEEEDNFQLLGL